MQLIKETAITRPTLKHIFNIAFTANVFEWYEFSIFGLLASTIGLLFFKTTYPIMAALQAFSVFAISYLMRPLGSLFFGYIGDRIGRSYALKLSLLMMAIPTACIGLLPTYSQIGVLATGLLIILRFIQGFAVGGELPSSASYVFDASKKKYRIQMTSIVWASAHVGFLCAAIVSFFLFRYFDRQTIFQWAWRIPFLLSIPLTLFIAYMRSSIAEIQTTPKNIYRKKVPFTFRALLPHDKYALLKGVLLSTFVTNCVSILSVWMPFYLEHFLGIDPSTAYLIDIISTLTLCFSPLLSSYLASLLGYHKIIKFFTAMILLCIYPLFSSLIKGNYSTLLTIQIVLAFLLGGIGGVIIEAIANMFPPTERSRGISFIFTLPIALFGGTAPLVCTYLTNKTGNLLFPALYILFFGLLTLPIILNLKANPEYET